MLGFELKFEFSKNKREKKQKCKKWKENRYDTKLKTTGMGSLLAGKATEFAKLPGFVNPEVLPLIKFMRSNQVGDGQTNRAILIVLNY